MFEAPCLTPLLLPGFIALAAVAMHGNYQMTPSLISVSKICSATPTAVTLSRWCQVLVGEKCENVSTCKLHHCLPSTAHTWYLSRTHGRCPWRKNLSCGEISNSCTWQMWRSLKFIHMWINFKFLHMTDVEKSKISFNMCKIYGILLHFRPFYCKICVFLAVFAVLSQN